MQAIMVAALRHKDGFALVDILQPCVTFNHVNTYKWYRERVRPVPADHDPFDRAKALELAFKWGDEIPVGIIYRGRRKPFESQLAELRKGTLVSRYGNTALAE
jgi:2-oxoglutarate ferredoxin oxidoreductase subunit beta